MGLPLRASLLGILLATSLLPLAALAAFDAARAAREGAVLQQLAFENAALAAAVRADQAAGQGADPLAAAQAGLPAAARAYLVDRQGAWRSLDGASGTSPALAALVGDRLSGSTEAPDPRTGEPALLAWARAPAADAAILLSRAPVETPPLAPALLAVGGLLAAGVFLVAVSVTRRVLGPIGRLEATSRRLAAGDWTVRAPVEGSREVERLAGSFNQMADALERQHAQLAGYAEHLDRLVRDRTKSLAESEADVERLNFTLAHELREPLRSMGTLASQALEDGSLEETQEVLAMLARRIGQLERVLLDLKRYEDLARQEAPMGPLDLGRVAEEAAASVRAADGARNVVLDPLPGLRGNPDLLRAAFEEALRNAVQHAGADSRIVVAGRVVDGRAIVTIDDEGPGIPIERREDVFHLFQRLRPDSPGTGVGLAIVGRVAARHDGAARFESSPGGGARLVLDLPVEGPAERAPAPERPPTRRF